MKLKTVKKLLAHKNIPTWKLIRLMGISRNTYYSYSHQSFKGIENKLDKALEQLGVIKHD